MFVNETSLKRQLDQRKRQSDLDRKRAQVFLDQLKTLCFGCIGASVLTPVFKTGDFALDAIGLGGWIVIGVSGAVLISMIWCADYVR